MTIREEILIKEFTNKYNYNIFIELFNKNLLTKEIFIKSIYIIYYQKNATIILRDAMKKIKDISDYYLNILLEDINDKLCSVYKISYTDFGELFKDFLTYAKNDISYYINNFLISYLKHSFLCEKIGEPSVYNYSIVTHYNYNIHILKFWLKLNMYKIQLNNHKIQLLFMDVDDMIRSLMFKRNIINAFDSKNTYKRTNTEKYKYICNTMDEIYFLIVRHLDNQIEKL